MERSQGYGYHSTGSGIADFGDTAMPRDFRPSAGSAPSSPVNLPDSSALSTATMPLAAAGGWASVDDQQLSGLAPAAAPTTSPAAGPSVSQAVPELAPPAVKTNAPAKGPNWFKAACGTVWSALVLAKDVVVGCAVEISKIAVEGWDILTDSQKRAAFFNTIKNGGVFLKNAFLELCSLAKKGGTLLYNAARDPEARRQLVAAVKANAKDLGAFLTNPATWASAKKFLSELSKTMGLTDIGEGLIKLFTNPLEGLGKIGTGLFKLTLECTGLADLGRGLLALSRHDRAGAMMYFTCAAGDLFKTACVVGAVVTGGVALAAVPGMLLGVTGLKKGAQKAALKGAAVIAKEIGEEYAEKITTHGLEEAGKLGLRRITGAVIKDGAKEIVEGFEGRLSSEAAVALTKLLKEAGTDISRGVLGREIVSPEIILEAIKKKAAGSAAGTQLLSELASLGDDAVLNFFKQGYSTAAAGASSGTVYRAALKSLQDLQHSAGFDADFVSKDMLARIRSYGKRSTKEIMDELRKYAPEATEKELKRMAVGLRHFAKNRLGKKFDETMARQLSQAISDEMGENFERRGAQAAFTKPVDEYGRTFGLSEETVAKWKDEYGKAFKKWEAALKKVVKEGVEGAIKALRTSKLSKKFWMPKASEVTKKAKRAYARCTAEEVPLEPGVTPTGVGRGARVSRRTEAKSGAPVDPLSGTGKATHTDYNPGFYTQVDSTLMRSDIDYRGIFHTDTRATAGEAPVAELPTAAPGAGKKGTRALTNETSGSDELNPIEEERQRLGKSASRTGRPSYTTPSSSSSAGVRAETTTVIKNVPVDQSTPVPGVTSGRKAA